MGSMITLIIVCSIIFFRGCSYPQKALAETIKSSPQVSLSMSHHSCMDEHVVCLFQKTVHPRAVMNALASTLDDGSYRVVIQIKNDQTTDNQNDCPSSHILCVFQKTSSVRSEMNAIASTVPDDGKTLLDIVIQIEPDNQAANHHDPLSAPVQLPPLPRTLLDLNKTPHHNRNDS